MICFQFLSGFQSVRNLVDAWGREINFQFLSGFQMISVSIANPPTNPFQFLSGFQEAVAELGSRPAIQAFNSFPDSSGWGCSGRLCQEHLDFQFLSGFQGEYVARIVGATIITFNSFPDSSLKTRLPEGRVLTDFQFLSGFQRNL